MARSTSSWAFATVAVASSMLSGCKAIEVIFKAGVWAGVIGVALILMLVFGLTRLLRRS